MLAEFNAVNEEIKRGVLTPHIGDSININNDQKETRRQIVADKEKFLFFKNLAIIFVFALQMIKLFYLATFIGYGKEIQDIAIKLHNNNKLLSPLLL